MPVVIRPDSPEYREHSVVIRPDSPEYRKHSVVIRPYSPEYREHSVVIRPDSPEYLEHSVVIRSDTPECKPLVAGSWTLLSWFKLERRPPSLIRATRIPILMPRSQSAATIRSFAPGSSRGLARADFPPFGNTLIFLNDEVTRVVTCFARVVTNFAGIPKKIYRRASIWCIFTVKIRGDSNRTNYRGKLRTS